MLPGRGPRIGEVEPFTVRLIVRRVKPTPGSQLALFTLNPGFRSWSVNVYL